MDTKNDNNENTKNSKKNEMELDFPFYNDNPKIKPLDIIILAIIPIFFTIYTFLPNNFLGSFGPYVFCVSELAAFLYVARGKLSLIIKKPKIRDIVRVIITLILQYIFVIAVGITLQLVFHLELNGNAVTEMEMNFKFWIAIIVQIFGEELYKLFIFLVVLILMNKLTKKRTLSIVIATIVTLLSFALIHATTYNSIVQILLCQGVATIFCQYNYLKTKNILTTYLQHLLLDFIPFILIMFDLLPKV